MIKVRLVRQEEIGGELVATLQEVREFSTELEAQAFEEGVQAGNEKESYTERVSMFTVQYNCSKCSRCFDTEKEAIKHYEEAHFGI